MSLLAHTSFTHQSASAPIPTKTSLLPAGHHITAPALRLSQRILTHTSNTENLSPLCLDGNLIFWFVFFYTYWSAIPADLGLAYPHSVHSDLLL